jgi:hypothetical protein
MIMPTKEAHMELFFTLEELDHMLDATDLAGAAWEGVGNTEATVQNEKLRDRIREAIDKLTPGVEGA